MKHRREPQELEIWNGSILAGILAFQNALIEDDDPAALARTDLPSARLSLAVGAPSRIITKADGLGQAKQQLVDPVSTIALFDGVAITEFDGLPASASRFL